MKLRIAGAQIPVVEDVAANLAALGRALDFAAAERADVLLTPEGSLSGYTHEFDSDIVARGLEKITARARGLSADLEVILFELIDKIETISPPN